MKALVTGGAGFLGKYVVTLLEGQEGVDVAALDNLDPVCGGTPGPHIKGDVTEFNQLEDIICGVQFDTIIHLAAYGRNLSCQDFADRAWDVNVNGTMNVLEVARRHKDIVKRVVCCSSNITLSDVDTVYKRTKKACEELIRIAAGDGVSCMGIRPSNIYGAGQSKTEYQPCAFAGLDKTFAEHGCFKITGDGTQARDWVHAEDVARAFWLAANSPVVGDTVDACTGVLTSMNEIASILGVRIDYVDPRPGDAKVLISNPQPAADRLGFRAALDLKDRIWDAFPAVQAWTLKELFGEAA